MAVVIAKKKNKEDPKSYSNNSPFIPNNKNKIQKRIVG